MPQSPFRILEPDGSLATGKSFKALKPEEIVRLYRTMILNRRVDERMVTLQRQGRIGFYIGSMGEEAAILGSAAAMKDEEWIVPCYRELGAALYRGYKLFDFFCQLFGNAKDASKGRQMPNHYALPQLKFGSISSPVGTQIPQATGMAMAARIMGRKEAVLVYFGDGATSEGDFHVGMNFAGVFKSPVVFVCRNNQWAISVPFSQQTASDTVAVKASAYGFDGVRVDGNDLFAVYEATRQATERARDGGGPTLIEAVTYRLGAHSTSDDPRAYREEEEVQEWQQLDPARRLRLYMTAQGFWDEAKQESLEEEVRNSIQETLKQAERVAPPALESMVEDVYDEVPWHLREQLEEVEAARGSELIEHEV